MKVCGKKLVKFCGHTHTHTRGSISSKDIHDLVHPPINYIYILACIKTCGILSITDMLSNIVAAYWMFLRTLKRRLIKIADF